ncbi:Dabb family protein [Nitratifractor sp.]
MVTHVVMIQFSDHPDKKERIEKAREMIEGMRGRVAPLRSLETGINFSPEERAMDLVLIARFDDREGLRTYAIDPVHKEVIDYIASVAEYTRVVDYEDR